jgi:hypothetical protein
MNGNQRMFDTFRGFSAKIIANPAKAKRRKVNNEVMLANKRNVMSGFIGMKNEEKVTK